MVFRSFFLLRAVRLSGFFGVKQFLFEPFANGQVIQTVRCVSREYGQYYGGHAQSYMHAERGILMILGPCYLHIDERVVCDVEQIGYVAQKFVENLRLCTRQTAARTHADDKREKEEYAHCFVKSVCPTCGAFVPPVPSKAWPDMLQGPVRTTRNHRVF